jgi:excisionase family DNA binding protein
MSVKEVASYISMSTDFVYENANELGGLKLGGRWRFRIDRVDSYIERGSLVPRGPQRITSS